MNSYSDSCSGSSGSLEVTAKQGGGPRTLPDPHSADLDTSASAKSSDTPSKRHKRMDRDERIAYLEDEIKKNTADIRDLSADVRRAMRQLTESLDEKQMEGIKEAMVNLKEDKDRLLTENAELKVELSALRNPKELVDAPVPAQGM